MAANDEDSGKSYPEMIMEAIDALNENNGSNKSAISKYLEGRYSDLPPSHASLLTAHLARLRETGELVFFKNNYFRPGPNSPPKRGRGRPPKPKPKPALPSGEEVPSPRPRGRPPKPKDSLSVSVAVAVAKVASGMPRPRGRPPKSATARPAASVPVAAGGVVKRGRGRPPKVKPSAEPALVTDAA